MSPSASRLEVISPAELAPARGYNHGMLAPRDGRLLFVAGQIGWDGEGRVADGFAAQFAQALDNVLAVVRAAGGDATDLARLTVYVVDREEYARELAAVGAAWRERLGRHYPAMALVEVAALLAPGARLEMEATAVVSPRPADGAPDAAEGP